MFSCFVLNLFYINICILDDYSMFFKYVEWLFNDLNDYLMMFYDFGWFFENFEILICFGARGFFESWRKNTKNQEKSMLGLNLVIFGHFLWFVLEFGSADFLKVEERRQQMIKNN